MPDHKGERAKEHQVRHVVLPAEIVRYPALSEPEVREAGGDRQADQHQEGIAHPLRQPDARDRAEGRRIDVMRASTDGTRIHWPPKQDRSPRKVVGLSPSPQGALELRS